MGLALPRRSTRQALAAMRSRFARKPRVEERKLILLMFILNLTSND
jgi:hypothetical protein